MCRDDVTFLKLSVVFCIFLNSIVGQLHEYLIIQRNIWIIVSILFGTCSNVAFIELVDTTIRRIEDNPYSNIKLSIEIKQWSLNELLNNKGVIFMLLILSISIFVFIHLNHVILIMGLKYWLSVSNTSSNTIIIAHDISKLVKVLEDMNADTSIESSRL